MDPYGRKRRGVDWGDESGEQLQRVPWIMALADAGRMLLAIAVNGPERQECLDRRTSSRTPARSSRRAARRRKT